MFHLYRVPANMALVLDWYLFIQTFPVEPELGFVIGLPRAVVDPVEVKLPHAAKKSSLDGDSVPHFPAKTLGRGCAGNCALAVFHKVLPLLFRDIKLRIDAALVIHANGKLSQETS